MKKVLIVDDQEAYLKSLELVLENKYRVTLAENLEEAEKHHYHHADLIITDLEFPLKPHTSLIDKNAGNILAERAPRRTPKIGMSMRPEGFDKHRFKTIFKKPVDVMTLLQAIDKYI